jgi:hypothetical protein
MWENDFFPSSTWITSCLHGLHALACKDLTCLVFKDALKVSFGKFTFHQNLNVVLCFLWKMWVFLCGKTKKTLLLNQALGLIWLAFVLSIYAWSMVIQSLVDHLILTKLVLCIWIRMEFKKLHLISEETCGTHEDRPGPTALFNKWVG